MPGASNIVPESKTPDMYCLDESNSGFCMPSLKCSAGTYVCVPSIYSRFCQREFASVCLGLFWRHPGPGRDR